jgi:hypothetical protein
METFVIAVVALIAFAAVMAPLLRGRGAAGDADEFDATPRQPPHGEPVAVPPMAAGPATPMAPVAPAAPAAPTDPPADRGDEAVEREVARYRAALRAGTICRKCGEANGAGSRFCADCGAALPLAEAEEFQ